MVQATKRRFVASSSSNDYEPVTGICIIEDFVAGKDPFRAAPFGLIPTPYPFHSGICSQKVASVAEAVETQYLKVLQKYSIKYSSILLLSVGPKCFPSDAVDTIIVQTSDVDYSKWKDAASEIVLIFYTAGLTPGEIKVEICNPVKMYHDDSRCLPPDQQLLSAIREIQPRVLDVVRKELSSIWTTIAYHMRGPREDESQMKPTVMITCEPGARHLFEIAEASIMAVVHSEKYPQVSLHVELVPGFVELVAPDQDAKSRPNFALKDKPINGASIGVPNQRLEAGTLGGWVTLKSIDNSNPSLQCALTYYHVIRKGDLANLDHHDHYGIGLDRRPLSQINVIWPAILDANATKAAVKKRIEAPGTSPRSRQQEINYLESVNTLSTAGPIGQVRFASGHRRTTENRRLDWALIVTPGTFTPNRPPLSSAFNNDPAWERQPAYVTSEDSVVAGFGVMKKGDWVFKTGRISTTSGEVNHISRRVNWKDHADSDETEVFGYARDFALGGDSGSMVFNDRKELVGLLIGAERSSSSWGLGFVTPIQAIRDDLRTTINSDIFLP